MLYELSEEQVREIYDAYGSSKKAIRTIVEIINELDLPIDEETFMEIVKEVAFMIETEIFEEKIGKYPDERACYSVEKATYKAIIERFDDSFYDALTNQKIKVLKQKMPPRFLQN